MGFRVVKRMKEEGGRRKPERRAAIVKRLQV